MASGINIIVLVLHVCRLEGAGVIKRFLRTMPMYWSPQYPEDPPVSVSERSLGGMKKGSVCLCVYMHTCVHIVWREYNVQIKDSEDGFSLTMKLVFLIPLINQKIYQTFLMHRAWFKKQRTSYKLVNSRLVGFRIFTVHPNKQKRVQWLLQLQPIS